MGCHRIYFVYLAVTAVGKCYPMSVYECDITFSMKDIPLTENFITALFLLSVDENTNDESWFQGEDNTIVNKEETFSSKNLKYQKVIHDGTSSSVATMDTNDTISILHGKSVSIDKINYKKMVQYSPGAPL
jgi:hypothetical protein